MNDEHPFLQELTSLRNAVAHYQHETHAAGLKLQRLSLDASTAFARLHAVQAENERLQRESAVHRAHPDVSRSADATAVQELTLALRRLSDKLDATDDALLIRNQELANAASERIRLKYAADNAFALAARLRAEVEAARANQRNLLARVKVAEEERDMSNLAVDEYASLVRSMEGKQSDTGGRKSVDGLASARLGLQRLLQESNINAEKSHAEISRLHALLEVAEAALEAEKRTRMESQKDLAGVQLELQRLKSDDKAAAKMVARYMKFSQSTTDILHSSMENLRQRHAVSLATAQERVRQSEETLVIERKQTERLRQALDELTEDISRESYGRRREVSLRLALLSREERLSESVRRWTLRSRESVRKAGYTCDACSQVFEKVFESVDDILRRLDDDEDATGSEARMAASQSNVASLIADLQRETDRRLFLERQMADGDKDRDAKVHEGTKSRLLEKAIESTSVSISPFSSTPPSASTASTSTSQGHSPVKSLSSESFSPPTDDDKFLKSEIVFPIVVVSEFPASTESVQQANKTDAVTEDIASTLAPCLCTESTEEENPLDDSLASIKANSEDEIIGSEVIGPPSPSSLHSLSAHDSTLKGLEDDSSLCAQHEDVPSHSEAVKESAMTISSDGDAQASREDGSDSTNVPCPSEELTAKPKYMNAEAKSENINEALQSSHLDSPLQNLLDQLRKIDNRYAGLQHSFRDCHISIEQVKSDFSEDHSEFASTLRMAVQRLDDYCEDARVELEIRVADEERIAKGYETLLSVPGALSYGVDGEEVNRQIKCFLDGSDTAVQRTTDIFKHKLGDLEHDIAKVKHAMFEVKGLVGETETVSAVNTTTKLASQSGWASWTTSILPLSRPSSPVPTFGSVVTSPRLRRSSSFQQQNAWQDDQDTIAKMGFRIPMPKRKAAHYITPSTMQNRPGPRPRVSSAIFNVGIGGGNGGPFGISSRKASFGRDCSDASNPPSPVSSLAWSSGQPLDDEVE